MVPTILKTYKRDRDAELGISATSVVDGMTDNPSFPDPPPSLEELKKILPGYGSVIASAKTRDLVAVSLKKDLKVKVVGYMTEIDAYVTEKCKGDRTMLLTSGFFISGEKNVVSEPVISKLFVELGAPGIITTRITRAKGTRIYFHQYATEPPTSSTSWHSESSVLPNFTFTGLISGKTYWMRVAIISKSGQWIYSPVESRIVQ
jgi:hypothetical protein